MALFPTIVSVVSFAAAALLLCALVASVLRRWRQAEVMSRVVVLLGPMVLIVCVVGFIALPLAFRADGLNIKAVVLTQGISATLNCGVAAYLSFLPGVIVWVVAHRRLRVTRR
jgi:predicted membrane protein